MRTLITTLTIFCIIISTSLASGESHEFCDNYTKTAIHQYQQAKSFGMSTPFPVWSDQYKHHYDWCRKQSRQAVQKGHDLRQQQIDAHQKSQPKKAMPITGGASASKQMIGIAKKIPAVPVKNTFLISNLTTASGKHYRTVHPVKVNSKVFVDRDFTYNRLPGSVMDGVQILTANEDKFSDGGKSFLKFTINQPAKVFVAYDRRYKKPPAWLDSFTKQPKPTVYSTSQGAVTGDVYQKHFSAGEVVLGGNLSKGAKENLSMYTVFVVPEKTGVSGAVKRTPRQKLMATVNDTRKEFEALMAKELPNYNRRLDKALQDHVKRQKKINAAAFNSLPTPEKIATHLISSIPNDGHPYALNLKEYEETPQKVGETITLQKKKNPGSSSVAVLAKQAANRIMDVKPQKITNVPTDGLAEIVSFPGTEALEPGDWVYISGSGFGQQPGTVQIQYTVNVDEFGAKWDTKTVTIKPGTHRMTWRNNLIVFRLPNVMPLVNAIDLSKGQGIGKAALTLTLANGTNIARPVTIDFASVNILDIWTDSSIDVTYYVPHTKDHWVKFKNPYNKSEYYTRMPDEMFADKIGAAYNSIEPGSEVYILGTGFGETPGQIEIRVGNKNVPITPLGKDWWSNYGIRFKVGHIPGHVSRDIGILKITTPDGRVVDNNDAFSFVYGPRMSVKVVSGNKWFEPEWDESTSFAKPDQNDLALFVSHDPGCGWFKTSESGWDSFFSKKPLPKGVMLRHFTFMEIEHDNANDQLAYLKNYLKDLLFSLGGVGVLDIALGVITENFKLLLEVGFDSLFGDGGGYYAYIPSLPQANMDSPSVNVKWENSCTGPNDGLPIMYVTTFVITGPKTVLDSM